MGWTSIFADIFYVLFWVFLIFGLESYSKFFIILIYISDSDVRISTNTVSLDNVSNYKPRHNCIHTVLITTLSYNSLMNIKLQTHFKLNHTPDFTNCYQQITSQKGSTNHNNTD